MVNLERKNNFFIENEFNEYYLSKLCLFSENEKKKVIDFKENLKSKITSTLTNKTQKSIKELIEYSNSVSSYGGIAIFAIIDNEDNKMLQELFLFLISEYKKITESKDEYMKDLFEIIASFSILFPQKIIRSVALSLSIEDLISLSNTFLKRPNALINFFIVLSELAMQTKNNFYLKQIDDLIEKMCNKISETSSLLPDLKDPLNAKLKEFSTLFKKYSSEDKKQSLENLALISTRKLDLGNLFHGFCMTNPSAAIDYINNNLTQQKLEILLKQMKIHQVLEIFNLFCLINKDSTLFISFIDYVKLNYNLTEDELEEKLQMIATAKEDNSCGILIRQIALMPSENKDSTLNCLNEMFNKLNILYNNLTANISDKILSISVVSLSRNNLIKEFEDKLAAKNPLLKKLRDKDIMSKIKNSNVSGLIYDQISCRFYISTLLSMIEVLAKNSESKRDEIILEAYKLVVKKYNHLVKKNFFDKICNIFLSKVEISESEYKN